MLVFQALFEHEGVLRPDRENQRQPEGKTEQEGIH